MNTPAHAHNRTCAVHTADTAKTLPTKAACVSMPAQTHADSLQCPGHVVHTPVSLQPPHLFFTDCRSMCGVCVSLIRCFSYGRSRSTSEAVLSPSSYASTLLHAALPFATPSPSQATAATRLQEKCTDASSPKLDPTSISCNTAATRLQRGCNTAVETLPAHTHLLAHARLPFKLSAVLSGARYSAGATRLPACF